MAAKVVIDMRPGKSFTTSQSNEHLRRLEDHERAKKAQWNYDPSREHLNFEIGKGGVVMDVVKAKSIPRRIEENLATRGIKDPNLKLVNQGEAPKYRTVVNFILGGNREVMRDLAFGNQAVNWEHGADNSMLERKPEIENWAKDAYKFMCKKYGEKNIAAFVVHLDEANPHIHCTVLPINQKEKFSFKSVFLDGVDTKDAFSEHMTKLHTEFADEVGVKYGMERGDSIKETGAKHRTTEEYRERLWKEARQKEAEVKENTKTIDTQKSIMDSPSREIKHATARIQALRTMVRNLETHKMDLEYEVRKLQRDLQDGKISQNEADRKLARINTDIEKTKEKIADKLVKLKIAERKLNAIEQKTIEAEAKKTEMEEKTAKAEERYEKFSKEMPAIKKQELQKMQAMCYKMCAMDFQKRMEKFNKAKEQMSKEQRSFLDKTLDEFWNGSMIGNVAENISGITSVATALFMGYLDGATDIAESHVGGGSLDSGWGKKDDEDDEAFRRRCLGMAMHMMRPQNKRGLHR